MTTGYQEYQLTDIDWLKEVPSTWQISSLKRAVEGCVNGIWGDEPDGENDLIVLRVADFDRSANAVADDKLTYRAITQKERSSRLLKRGDLLIEKSGGGEKTLVGAVVLFDKAYQAVTSNFVAKMTPKSGFDSRFLNYVFAHLYSGNVNYPCIKQTTGIQNIDSDAYLSSYFAYPAQPEQKLIANYLDIESSRIDSLISEKQRFIELLKEKRQALISHVVTKGLDANVEMKDSGVEWMGSIPAHWNVKKLKTIGKAIIGLTYSPDDVQDDGTIVLRSTNIQEGKISLHDNVYVDKQIPAKLTTKLNDILICSRNGSRKLIGKNALIDEKSVGMSFGAFTTVFRSDINKFVHLLLNSSLFDYQAGMFLTTTVNQLTTGMLNNFEVPVPPIEEQSAIVDEANRQTEKFDLLIKETICSIDLLKEHRSALISAAVTGKIDVRGFDNKGAA